MKMPNWKKPRIWIIIIVILGIAGYWFYKNGPKPADMQYVTATVQKATLISSITGTGQINAENKIDLKAESSGAVVSVPVKIGQHVKQGQAIVVFDQRAASVAYQQAAASVESAKASYDKLIAGATSDDIALANLSVKSAQNALDNANADVDRVTKQQETAVNNAKITLNNAGITAHAAQNNVTTAIPTISGTYTSEEQGTYELRLYQGGSGLRYSVSGLESLDGAVNMGSPAPLGTRGLYIQFPSTVSVADTWSISVPNTQATTYVSALNAYQSALETQATALLDAKNAVKSAEINLEQSQIALSQKQAAAAPADVSVAQAQISNAQSQLAAAANDLANCTLRAPFEGDITALTAQKGDQGSNGAVVGTLMTKQQVATITLNEVDAAKVKVDDKVTLTFDAIDGLTIAGHIASIDPVGTVTQGVVSYTTTIALDTQDDRVKSGMSVTASIILDVKADVLSVPASAVKAQGTSNYVEVFSSNAKFTPVAGSQSQRASEVPTRQTVQVGISSDTAVEIVSGLQEGQIVVVQSFDANAKTASAATGASAVKIPGLTGGSAGGGGAFRGGGGGAAARIGG